MITSGKLSGYYFYMNQNMYGDFQICINVPLIKFVGATQDTQRTIWYFNGLLSWSSEIIILNRIMQSCQKFDSADVNIPCEERKALVPVINWWYW